MLHVIKTEGHFMILVMVNDVGIAQYTKIRNVFDIHNQPIGV